MQLALTAQATYAIRAALDLASHPLELRKRREIAAATSAPSSTLAHVLNRLRRAGLVEATAGPSGGYHLGRSPAEISVVEVIEAVEGELAARTCVLRGIPCDGSCAFHETWRSAQEALLGALGSATLGDLARGNVAT